MGWWHLLAFSGSSSDRFVSSQSVFIALTALVQVLAFLPSGTSLSQVLRREALCYFFSVGCWGTAMHSHVAPSLPPYKNLLVKGFALDPMCLQLSSTPVFHLMKLHVIHSAPLDQTTETWKWQDQMELVSSLVSMLSLKVSKSKRIGKNTEAGQLYWILSQILSRRVANLFRSLLDPSIFMVSLIRRHGL